MSDWVLVGCTMHKLVIIKQTQTLCVTVCVCVLRMRNLCRGTVMAGFLLHFYGGGGSAGVKVEAKGQKGQAQRQKLAAIP